MYKLIQVKYRNNHEGLVHAVMLNDLIVSKKIKKFYRPSENRWVDVDYDLVRIKENGYMGPERRDSFKKRQERKPFSFLPRFLKYKKPLTAQGWFEEGFALFYNEHNQYNAITAFTMSIKLDPSDSRVYLYRGMAYEQIDKGQEALEDYSKAIQLLPNDAKAFYMRGMLFWRSGNDVIAIADLKKSAELGYKPAIDFCTRKGIDWSENLT